MIRVPTGQTCRTKSKLINPYCISREAGMRLFASLFYSQQYDYRENVMLQNIYNYSKENQYNKAVFLIGAEHQRSIVQKIKEHEKLSEIKLNWTM